MKYAFKTVSSLEKVFFSDFQNLPESTSGSMLKNEIYSFQLVGQMMNDGWPHRSDCTITVESPISQYISMYRVDYVPSMLPAYPECSCQDYLSKEIGLYPDPLYAVVDGKWDLYNSQSRSVWIAVEPKGEVFGDFPITLHIQDEEGNLVGKQTYQLQIIDCELPDLPIYTTGWFHGDCISTHHHVAMQSEEYFQLIEEYLAVYCKFGHNTILTPIFTPPLDTAIGEERPTNQLVGVFQNEGRYSFDFHLLKRWIQLCQKVGLKYFEISHMFSQWGARYAPKVMGTVDGKYCRLFGWETDATGEAYTHFLQAFLPELIQFLKDEKIFDKCLFHVSDEPTVENEAQYIAAKNVLLDFIPEDQLIDALGEYALYSSGAVKHPVVTNSHIHEFLEKGVTDLWTYYCCSQGEKVSNRFMAMPSYRNRVLGCQLFKFRIKGFLQWGFNFWYSQRSVRKVDPYRETCGNGAFPSGDAFIVYPKTADGELVKSLRLYVFHEGLQDYRALELLRTLEGEESADALLDSIQGFGNYPRNSEFYLDLRKEINRRIQAAINRA